MAHRPRTRATRMVVLGAYFSLLGFLVAWYAWLAPSAHFPVAISLLFMVTPLLALLRGVLAGRPRTHLWLGVLALVYFSHGISQAWAVADDRIYAGIEAGLGCLLFWGSVLFARYRSRELSSAVHREGRP